MIKKLVISVYNKIISYSYKFKKIRFFYFPNLVILSKNQVFIEKGFNVNQITRFTGLGEIKIGSNVTFGYKPGGFYYGPGIELQVRTKFSKIKVGNNVSTNNNVLMISSGSICIGDQCLIGQNVTFMDFEAHGISPNERKKVGEIGVIEIGKNVWIGNNALILKNSFIGDNSIVAAGAVVSGKFPNNVVIGGIPAKIIKQI